MVWGHRRTVSGLAGVLILASAAIGSYRAQAMVTSFKVVGRLVFVDRPAATKKGEATTAGSRLIALQDVPVPPPPPGPGGCRGPACVPPPAIPRDEIVISLPASVDKQGASEPGIADAPLIDTSNLDIQPGSLNESVTSGADSSAWTVESVNSYETCTASGATQSGKTSVICDTGAQQKQEKPPK